MKKILLLLLAPIIIGGMSVSCKNKKEASTANENTTDKWVINKVNANTSTGKLFVDLPKDTKWDITIYTAAAIKYFPIPCFNRILFYYPAVMTWRSIISG